MVGDVHAPKPSQRESTMIWLLGQRVWTSLMSWM